MKRAIVTGATGMIGTALTKILLNARVEVVAVIRPSSGHRERFVKEMDRLGNVKENLHIVTADLSEIGSDEALASIKRAFKSESCDVVFHLGWEGTFGEGRNDAELQARNVSDTLELAWLSYRMGADVFVGTGSQAEYGRVSNGEKLSWVTMTKPETEYGKAKLRAGIESRAICRSLRVRHIWCRILSVYGPGDSSGTMVMSGIYSLLRGERPQYTRGEQLWDYLYADDAAAALYALASDGVDGKVYALGSGRVRPLREYIEIIRDTVNPAADIGIGELPYPPGQVMYLCADVSDLQKDTGFEAGTTFEEGIKKTVEWARGQIHEDD